MSSPAGWYPDPTDASVRRWWDGRRWTGRLTRADEAGEARVDDEHRSAGRWWRRRTQDVDGTASPE